MGEPAARLTDMHICPLWSGDVPHVGGPIESPGEPTVLIGGLPAARVTDMAYCNGPPDVIVEGSPTVYIGGLMAARLGDSTAHGGMVIEGEPTVLIGDGSGGSDGDSDDLECGDDDPEDDDSSDDEKEDSADALFGDWDDKFIPTKKSSPDEKDSPDEKSGPDEKGSRVKVKTALTLEKTWLDKSGAAFTFGDKDNNIKLLSADASISSSLEYDPRTHEFDANLLAASASVTAISAQAQQSVGNSTVKATAKESVDIGKLEGSANASASYKDGSLDAKASAGASATLVQGTAQGSVTISLGDIYNNTIGKITSSQAPSWLAPVALVVGGQAQAGIGASASASAEGEIGDHGFKFSAGTKVGAGPMLGFNLSLGVVW